MRRRDILSLSAVSALTILLLLLVLRVTGHVTPLLAVKSGSMYPVLEVGDVILMQPVSQEEIEVGDVVIFYKPGTGELVVHRVVGKTSEGLYTKGDANPSIDWWSPLPYEYVVGRWTGFKIPNWLGIGYLSLFLSGELYPPYGRITLIGLLILNVALLIRDLLRHVPSSRGAGSEGDGGRSAEQDAP